MYATCPCTIIEWRDAQSYGNTPRGSNPRAVMGPPAVVMDPPLSDEELAMQAMGLPTMFSKKPLKKAGQENTSVISRGPSHQANFNVRDQNMIKPKENEGLEEGEYEEGEISDTPPTLHPPKTQVKRDHMKARRKFDGFSYANDMVEDSSYNDFHQGKNLLMVHI